MALSSAHRFGILMTAALLLSCKASVDAPPPLNSELSPSALADQSSVVDGNLTFGLDIFALAAETRKAPTDNVFISPISISSAFGLVYAGAGGETADEIAATLSFNLPVERQHEALGSLQKRLEDPTKGRLFNLANNLFIDKSLTLEPSYKDRVQTSYGAIESKVDYRNQAGRAVKTINRWVSKQTRGLIKETISEAAASKDTRAVLVNTAYLKADWLSPFKKAITHEQIFYGPDGEIRTPMMKDLRDLVHLDGNSFQAVNIPYKDNTMSMVVILPDSKDGAETLLNSLSPRSVTDILKTLDTSQTRPVDISFPKVNLDAEYTLNALLHTLGIKTAFTRHADFKGITKSTSLKIDSVFHKTVLKVDETGTEAAAVTGIKVEIASVQMPVTPITFDVNHPYIILLRHTDTQAVLFMGLINTPCPKACE